MNSFVRLAVSPTATSTPTGVFNQRFEALFPRTETLGCTGLSCSPVVSPGLSTHECGTAQSAICCLAGPPAWLSDFHTVQFSVSSGCFLFLNLLLSFWLCEEAKCIYLGLHRGWKCHILFFLLLYLIEHLLWTTRCANSTLYKIFHLILL